MNPASHAPPADGPWRSAAARLLLALALLAAALGVAWGAPGTRVVVLASGEGEPYREFQDALRAGLGGEPRVVVAGRPEAAEALRDAPGSVVVALGLKAAEAAAASDRRGAVLVSLLPRASFEALAERYKREPGRFSAIHLDQPYARQLKLVRLAMPQRERLGVLLGPDSDAEAGLLRAAAESENLTLRLARVGGEADLFPRLRELLGESDVVLALPHRLVFNRRTVQSLLLETYRARIPVVGPSAAYVQAGAMIAVHSSPEQLGRQTAEVLKALPGGEDPRLPPPQYPRHFSVSVNQTVARSLGLVVEDEQALARRLGAAGDKP